MMRVLMSIDETLLPEPDKVEVRYPGIECAWFFDKRIVSYRLTAVSPDVVKNWSKLILEVMEEWDKRLPYLALHNLSNPGIALHFATLVEFDFMNIGITEAGREAVENLLDQHPDFEVYVATCFNIALSGRMGKMLMDRTLTFDRRIHTKSYYHQGKSFDWLKTFLPSEFAEAASR